MILVSPAAAQVATDGDLPAILNDGSSGTTAYYELGEAADYQFNLSDTGETSFVVGQSNPRNTLTVKNGADADFEGGIVYVGSRSTSANNNFYVTGSGTTVTNTSALLIGSGGSDSNLLSVFSNSAFTAGGDVYIGQTSGSDSNQLAVSGSATFDNASSRDVYVGNYGSNNRLSVASGGQVTLSRALEIGYHGTSTTVSVTDSGSVLDVAGRIQFGRGGGSGSSLGVYNGADLINGNDVTFFGSDSAMIVDGSGSTATLTGLDLGYGGSTGNTLTVSAAALVALTQSDVALVVGNTIRIDEGYLAWVGDRTSNFASFISNNFFEISDGSGGWLTATSEDLNYTYFDGDDAAALAFSGYEDLGNYTIISTVSAVPEPSTYAAIFGGFALASAALRRKRLSRSAN